MLLLGCWPLNVNPPALPKGDDDAVLLPPNAIGVVPAGFAPKTFGVAFEVELPAAPSPNANGELLFVEPKPPGAGVFVDAAGCVADDPNADG